MSNTVTVQLPEGVTVTGASGAGQTAIEIREPTGKEFLNYGSMSVVKQKQTLDENGDVVEVEITQAVDFPIAKKYLTVCADTPISEIEKMPLRVVDECIGALLGFLAPPKQETETK